MLYVQDLKPNQATIEKGIIQIKVWEVFLIRNRQNLYNTLKLYSLDGGPIDKDQEYMGTVSFRFTQFDWTKTLKDLLNKHNVPFINEHDEQG